MSWRTFSNYAESRLTNTKMFGGIRRDSVTRKAQIAVYRKVGAPTEWVDLIDYRYGMNEDEIAQDIQATGISDEEWKKKMAELRSKPYIKPAHFNGERIFV